MIPGTRAAQLFRSRAPDAEAIDLIARMLEYVPHVRTPPYQQHASTYWVG